MQAEMTTFKFYVTDSVGTVALYVFYAVEIV